MTEEELKPAEPAPAMPPMLEKPAVTMCHVTAAFNHLQLATHQLNQAIASIVLSDQVKPLFEEQVTPPMRGYLLLEHAGRAYTIQIEITQCEDGDSLVSSPQNETFARARTLEAATTAFKTAFVDALQSTT